MFESLQQPLYLATLLFALLTAFLGIIVVDRLYKNRSHQQLDGVILIVFSLLALGYGIFALGELSWYLIFDIFKETPSLSMPDFYWVVGSLILLLAFAIFSVYMHTRHGGTNKTAALVIFAVVVLGSVGIYISSLHLTSGSGTGKLFLGYFYPLVSSLILIASLSVYLFFEKISVLRNNLLLLMIANASFLIGDLLYIYYTVNGGYGLPGLFSDLLYVLAYGLCTISFFSLLLKVRKPELELE